MQKSACFLAVALMTLFSLPAKAVQVEEYELKTAYLYNFALFTTWPAEALAGSDSIVICTMGNDRFGSHIEQLQGRKVRDKQLVVRRGVDLEQASSCHMLYIAENDHEKMAVILEALRGTNVLTVSDILQAQSETTRGAGNLAVDKAPRCMIMLILEEKRLMFEVDSTAASQAGLTMSSRLLHLARHVY